MSRLLSLLAVPVLAISVRADDWPQWFGPKRDGVWREDGILDRFPEPNSGRDVVWCHPAFANRCVFVRNDKEIVCVSMEG